MGWGVVIDTEYDRASTMEIIPALPYKGTQGVQARYDAELPLIISIVRYPGRPVILQHGNKLVWAMVHTIGSFVLDKVLCRWPLFAVHPCKQGQGMSRINAPLPQPLFATGEGMGLVATQITGEVACRDGQLSHSLDCSRHISEKSSCP